MLNRQTGLSGLMLVAGALVSLSAQAQPGPAPTKGGDDRSGDYIRAEVMGRFSKAAGTGGEHTGFQITANGVTWDVDASANKALLQMAEQLDGKPAIAIGTYAERRDSPRVRQILTAEALASGPEKGRGETIHVTIHGRLRSGVMAIGAETTGVTITAGAVTWDLELQGNQRQTAGKLNGSKAIISGRLRHEAGVEIKNRFIVKVRSIKSAMR